MATLHIEGAPSALMARLRKAAKARDVPFSQYVLEALEHDLDAREAASRGGRASAERLTPEERSERARRAVAAREAGRRDR